MPHSHPQPLDRTNALRRVRHLLPGAMALASVAGFVNSVVLGFFHTPVSHMTGAVSHLGIDLATGHPKDVLASLSIVVGFLAGAVVAGLLVGALRLIPGRSYGIALMAEGGLLMTASALLATGHRIGLPVVAMACGLQNAMASSYCGLVIRTTHVTGTVTDIGVMLGHWLRHRQIDWWKLRFLSLLAFSFGAGGYGGALAGFRFGTISIAVTAAVVTVAGGTFWFLHHRGIVDLLQDAGVAPPRTGSFPVLPGEPRR
ncbi:MAG: DUF1275 domain-containing protein [Verrucomicrobia bacterium]|nr:MAG: DUF1275 domain-containing protein [Verrucomicrobiota bacterium]